MFNTPIGNDRKRAIVTIATILIILFVMAALGIFATTYDPHDNYLDATENTKPCHAQILMLDGSIVEGTCTYYTFYDNQTAKIIIDDVLYTVSKDRVIIADQNLYGYNNQTLPAD